MYASIFTKATRDAGPGMVGAALAVGAMLILGMAVYKDIDLSIYEGLPPIFLELMGIPAEADAASLALGAIYSFMGALTIAALALSIGSAAVAGEESKGTIGLLLANPKSRTNLYLSKTLSMLALVAVGCVILWGAGLVTPAILGVDMTGVEVGALVIHMGVNALFYGSVALAVGAWTGFASRASGTAAGVMIVSYLGAGLLPLVEGFEEWAKLFPWYYYTNGNPVVNGVDWGDLSVLLGVGAALVLVGLVGLNRRDLKTRNVAKTLIDRLRENRLTASMAERLAGRARVSRISLKTASEHQGLLVVCASILFFMTLMMGPLYGFMDDAIRDLWDQFPDVLLAMIGGADMSTPEGFLQGEIFSITAPVTFTVLTAIIGARAIAGEEDRETLDLLLANPVTRSRVILEKTWAMVGYTIALGIVTFVATLATVTLGNLDIPLTNIAAICLLLSLLGLVLGAVALLVGAATGRVKLAGYAAAGVTFTAYFVYSFLPLSERLAPWAKLSPFYFYLGGDPLGTGIDWLHALVLAGLFVGLVLLSLPLLQRRDLR